MRRQQGVIARVAAAAVAATLPLLLSYSTCAAAEAPERASLSTLLTRYAAWHGGAASIEAITFLSYDFELWDKGKTYLVRFAGTPGGSVRVDAYRDGKHLISEGIDAKGGWTWRSDLAAPQAASAAGTAALHHGQAFNVLFLNQLPRRGHELKLDDNGSSHGEAMVKVTLSDGFESWLLLDPSTGRLLRKRDRSSLHPDIDPSQQWFETSFSDFITANGVKLWRRSETREVTTGKVVQRIVRKNFAFAPPAPDYLDRNRKAPPAIRTTN